MKRSIPCLFFLILRLTVRGFFLCTPREADLQLQQSLPHVLHTTVTDGHHNVAAANEETDAEEPEASTVHALIDLMCSDLELSDFARDTLKLAPCDTISRRFGHEEPEVAEVAAVAGVFGAPAPFAFGQPQEQPWAPRFNGFGNNNDGFGNNNGIFGNNNGGFGNNNRGFGNNNGIFGNNGRGGFGEVPARQRVLLPAIKHVSEQKLALYVWRERHGCKPVLLNDWLQTIRLFSIEPHITQVWPNAVSQSSTGIAINKPDSCASSEILPVSTAILDSTRVSHTAACSVCAYAISGHDIPHLLAEMSRSSDLCFPSVLSAMFPDEPIQPVLEDVKEEKSADIDGQLKHGLELSDMMPGVLAIPSSTVYCQ